MSESRKIKRTLRASLRSIEGCGDEITFKIEAHRTTAAGTFEAYELELKACRHSVRELLAELRKMHHRDRDRLRHEQARIEREIRELTQEQA